jgi:hypothetical protein
MTTQCNTPDFDFEPLAQRQVTARFDGGAISSDGGCLLLAEVERRTRILHRLAQAFTDHRDPQRTEHSVLQLLSQRVYALCLGYEDLNDHDTLRLDPLLATLVGKADPTGHDRARAQDQGKALAGKSTLNRLELTPPDASADSRYQKIVAHPEAIDRLFVAVFLEAYPTPPARIVLDLDATDDPVHGKQEGRFFHGYYGEYCYLPLYIFCGDHLLGARLRTADHGEAHGALAELQRVVAQIRTVWPRVRILVRGDSGFCRDEIMAWCETNGVDYLFGLARNRRLEEMIAAELADAHVRYLSTGVAARVFAELRYRTLDSWSCERRVVAKAEYLPKGPNPRFVVTSLTLQEREARPLYEEDYCGRGDMENRIKEQQLWLFADRTSTELLRSNQLRLYFSSVAYLLLEALRRLGLGGTQLARAQCGTLRLALLKIGALVRVTVRRVWVSLASACPWREVFARAYEQLREGSGPAVVPLRC